MRVIIAEQTSIQYGCIMLMDWLGLKAIRPEWKLLK